MYCYLYLYSNIITVIINILKGNYYNISNNQISKKKFFDTEIVSNSKHIMKLIYTFIQYKDLFRYTATSPQFFPKIEKFPRVTFFSQFSSSIFIAKNCKVMVLFMIR